MIRCERWEVQQAGKITSIKRGIGEYICNAPLFAGEEEIRDRIDAISTILSKERNKGYMYDDLTSLKLAQFFPTRY